MKVPYYTLVLESFDKKFYLHYSSTLDNHEFNICSLSAKRWKKPETARKWLRCCPFPGVRIEEVIYDEIYYIDNSGNHYVDRMPIQ